MAAELFAYMAGVRLTHVPYKGGGPAFTDLLGGHVHVMFAAAPTTLASVRSGKVRALGVSTARRSHFLPEIPTIAEAGVPGYEVNSWSALFATVILRYWSVNRQPLVRRQESRGKIGTHTIS